MNDRLEIATRIIAGHASSGGTINKWYVEHALAMADYLITEEQETNPVAIMAAQQKYQNPPPLR
jgi:hypothetical protein